MPGVIGRAAGRTLSEREIREVVAQGLGSLAIDGRRVLVLIPDGTRTMPMPLLFRLLGETVGPRAAALDYLVALGTHPPLDDAQLSRLVGRPVSGGRAGDSRIHNHRWDIPSTFAPIGTIPAREIGQITGGLLSMDLRVTINKLIFDYDQLVICGPVFPHEVVGFSGGHKYLFPGIAGREIIDVTHWLGALTTTSGIIGRVSTPVRAVIDRAASLVARPVSCMALVVTHDGVAGVYCGEPQQAWAAAAALSAKRHVVYVARPFRRVLSVMPRMYEDLWTASKGMYKVEPVVADGGEVVIYAPHLHEVSFTHGRLIEEIGYHCRDYFVARWDEFRDYPLGVLAHCAHLKGRGRYDTAEGREEPRIHVTLATKISRERCRKINLGYLDPRSARPEEWEGREGEGVLVVPNAGETLYRLESERP